MKQEVSAELHEWVSVCLFFFPWPYSVKACIGREMDYLHSAYPVPPARAWMWLETLELVCARV